MRESSFGVIGFAFMFSHGNGFIGYHWFFLQNAPDTYESTGVAFLVVWIFNPPLGRCPLSTITVWSR